MSWLNIRTGYSFKMVFAHLDEITKKCEKFAGIADLDNTYGFIKWRNICKNNGIKPVYGVRIRISDLHPKGSNLKRYQNCEMTFIAKNTQGVSELYQLVDLAHKQFYQFPKLTYSQLNSTSENIIVLCGISPELNKIKREFFFQLSPNLPKNLYGEINSSNAVACIDNYFTNKTDKIAYESFTHDQHCMESKTTPMHILNDKEWKDCFPELSKKIKNNALILRNEILKTCSNVELPIAPMVKYDTKHPNDYLKRLCKVGAIKRKIKLKGKYKTRLKYELSLIKEKKFADYFLIVSDLIEYCKTKTVVGPGRGSSAGSLICYLIGITEIDPLKYNLLFERFIDINRSDWPDIDFDLQDQSIAIKYLQKLYGVDCVAQIGNINKLQPKSAIARVSKNLNIPPWEIDDFKESIEERPEGDKRARYAIEDAFKNKLGMSVLKQYPNFFHVSQLEGHPSHLGIHAAGIIVCPVPINRFCGINSRDKLKHIAMVDKRDAEEINLLKIDALGLTTLNILASICQQLGEAPTWLYTLPLDDKKTYKLLNNQNLSGIFQMEGNSLKELAKEINIKTIEDIAALSALCRPGPLMSGAAHKYVKQHSGKAKPEYISKHESFIKWTETTFGNIVYQEQLMGIVREMANLSWKDVMKIRKLMGKSQGDEAFQEYENKFISGAIKNGAKEKDAIKVWSGMKNFGKYGFNLSHAISYAIITYLCAYFKANYPLQFAVGLLNSTNNNLTALKILRDLKERENIDYVHFDFKKSEKEWSVKNKILYGGFLTVDGIGPGNANTILKCREEKRPLPEGIRKKLEIGINPFKYLYPGKEVYGKYYKKKWNATFIKDIKKEKEYVFIGMLTKRMVKDLNDQKTVAKREGKEVYGPSTYISMLVEDDTGSIAVSINRFKFKELGDIVLEDTQINKDWFIFYGKFVKQYNRIYCEDIKKITKGY